MSQLITKHALPFEDAPWELGEILNMVGKTKEGNFRRFRIGTCTGLWQCTLTTYDILAIDNDNKGNGHFEDVLQWFEHSAKRDKRDFRILEVWNKKLKKHLIEKRGFQAVGKHDVIKKFF